MKLYTPDKQMLMEISSIKEHPEGILIEGKIMGAMPMKAILRPEELRAGYKLASWGVARRILGMFVGGRGKAAR